MHTIVSMLKGPLVKGGFGFLERLSGDSLE